MDENNKDNLDSDLSSSRSDNVFEITPDLNISPIKEEDHGTVSVPVAPPPPPPPQPPTPVSPLPPTPQAPPVKSVNLLDEHNAIAESIHVKPAEPTIASVGEAELPRFKPSNPSAKTIYAPHVVGLGEEPSLRQSVAQINTGADQTKVEAAVKSDLKPIRTYESDVAEVMSHKKVSAASMVIAENRRTEEAQVVEEHTVKAPSQAPKNIFFIVASLFLIIGGGLGAYYLYTVSPIGPIVQTPNIPVNQNQTIPAIVTADAQTVVNIGTLQGPALAAKLKVELEKSQAAGTIREIIPVTLDGENAVRVHSGVIIDKLEIPMPDILKRSLLSAWMLGSYANASGQKSVFVVAQNNFFQNAFAGMLSWESLMPDDLKSYLYIAMPASTTTATSSQGQKFFTIRGTFEDRIIKNKDVREFVTSDGRVLFLYSFISPDKIVFTDAETTLAEILTRLDKQALSR